MYGLTSHTNLKRTLFGRRAFVRFCIVACLVLTASLVAHEQVNASHVLQPAERVRLSAPWTPNDTGIRENGAGATLNGDRYPVTYCTGSQQTETGSCLENGHGSGLWASVDFYTALKPDQDDENVDMRAGGWKVLAAHSGTAVFLPDFEIAVINNTVGILTYYNHTCFEAANCPTSITQGYNVAQGTTKLVQVGDLLGYTLTSDDAAAFKDRPGQGLHLMLTVYKRVDGSVDCQTVSGVTLTGCWKHVDLRYVEFDGERIFDGDYIDPPASDNWDGSTLDAVRDDAVTSYEGFLTQAESGASNETNDQFGSTIATGDFNGDGKDDLAIGVPGENFDGANDTGMVVVYYGSSTGLKSTGSQRWGQTHSGATNETGDQFGASLAAGDFNGDGKDDLAIGTPFEDLDGATDSGTIYIYHGSSGGLRKGQASASAIANSASSFRDFKKLALSSIQTLFKPSGVQFVILDQQIKAWQIQIYDTAGQRVFQSAWMHGHALEWQLVDHQGRQLANGVYLYVITAQGSNGEKMHSKIRKLIVLR